MVTELLETVLGAVSSNIHVLLWFLNSVHEAHESSTFSSWTNGIHCILLNNRFLDPVFNSLS
jgi:hypothetical protein